MKTELAGGVGKDEISLYESALRGDREAFAQLLQSYRPQLKNYLSGRICGIMRQRIDASDVIQDAAVHGMRASAAIDYLLTQSPLRGLQLLVSGRLYDIFRFHLDREKRDPRRERSLDNGDSSTMALAQLLADSMPSPSQNLLEAEKILVVHQALDSMDESDRQILIWVHYESLTRIVIAERLGISEEAAQALQSGIDEVCRNHGAAWFQGSG